MLFPMKSKEKTILSMSATGAGVGLFILTPLISFLLHLIHNDLLFTFQTFFSTSENMFTNVLFVVTGATAGLLAGYLCSIWRIKKYQIEEVRQCLELVINSMGEKISIVDENHKILFCNSAYAQSVSGSPGELIGTSYQQTGKQCLVQRTFETGAPQVGIENEVTGVHPVIIEKKTYPLKDSAGRTICCVAIANDITLQKQMEDSLRQAQKMEAIGTLAGGIAHDFNNILSAVIGYSDLGLLVTNQEQQVYKYLKSILKAGIRGKGLTEQILDFSRKKPLRKEPIIVSLIIQEALKLLRASMPTTIKIQTRILAKEARIMADSTQIHQILMNLCTNARHAIGDKAGVLGIQLVTKQIDQKDGRKIEGLKTGSYLQLTVSDTGHGIDKAVLPRIFEPFFTTKRDGEGTGMGLAVVHGITKSCGGCITVVSKVGKGTTFHLLFPLLAEKVEVRVKQEMVPRRLATGKGRIMIVDDEKELVLMLQEMLQFLGYQVEPVTSSLEAINKFRQKPANYDLVITDYTMPDKTGFELAREILVCRPDIPIVMTSGYTDTITPQDAYDAGIVDFLLKPLQLQQVADSIENATGIFIK